ncbi:hypothetical protein MPER_04025 [Moniliophthora perniciosa FA553]|nr:hypothetical protein MPER_04025 [Moniliophthora perniciosa FA553]
MVVKRWCPVVEGGIRIAAIEQRDLEYDPALYRRDRGELDWDARSMASTAYFNDAASSMHFGGGTPNLPGYDKYLVAGPGNHYGPSTENFELARMDSQQEPLLGNSHLYQNPSGYASRPSIPASPAMSYQDPSSEGFARQAPIHRPQESYGPDYSRGSCTCADEKWEFESRPDTDDADDESWADECDGQSESWTNEYDGWWLSRLPKRRQPDAVPSSAFTAVLL